MLVKSYSLLTPQGCKRLIFVIIFFKRNDFEASVITSSKRTSNFFHSLSRYYRLEIENTGSNISIVTLLKYRYG